MITISVLSLAVPQHVSCLGVVIPWRLMCHLRRLSSLIFRSRAPLRQYIKFFNSWAWLYVGKKRCPAQSDLCRWSQQVCWEKALLQAKKIIVIPDLQNGHAEASVFEPYWYFVRCLETQAVKTLNVILPRWWKDWFRNVIRDCASDGRKQG